MTIRIVTDSSCDLPQNLVDQHRITVVSLSIRFGDEEFIDRTGITTEEFWSRCESSPTLPETAAPSPGQFEEAYRQLKAEGASGIVVIALSSSLSATMQSAEIGARSMNDEIPITIIDSRNASLGLGLTVLECAEAAERGASMNDIVALANDLIPRTKLFGALDTLENLKKGGRISSAKALMATALAIKPLIEVQDGILAEAGRARTRSKALAHLHDVLKSHPSAERLAILQAQCPDTEQFIAKAREFYSGDIIVGDIGAVIGTHAGKGTIGIAFRVPK